MAFGVGFRVSPGVRLRVTRRGPRMSLGPRIARVHLGGGRTAVSTGHGPVTFWHALSGGGHQRPDRAPTGQAKADAWHRARNRLDALLSAHEAPVEHARPPVVPPPQPAARRDVRRELRRRATAGVAWWHFGARRQARRRADEQVDGELARRQAEVDAALARQQAEADAWWQRLCANDPDTVVERLEHAFGEHALPASVTAVTDATVHLVIPVDPPERLVGEREPTLTDKGNLSLARMTQTRRNELYTSAISSAVVAVAAETFAVAPGADRVDVAVVAPEHPEGPSVLALAELTRDLVLPGGRTTPAMSELVRAAEAGRATLAIDRGGRTGDLRPLDTSDRDLTALLDMLDVE